MTGVKLRVDKPVAETNKPVTFTADHYPSTAIVEYYLWDVGTAKNSEKQTILHTLSYNYTVAGR